MGSTDWTYPTDLFRSRAEQLLARGATLSDLAMRGGFCNGRESRPDTTWFARACGLKLNSPTKKNGRVYAPHGPRQNVSYETAVRLCDALGIDYTEVGV